MMTSYTVDELLPENRDRVWRNQAHTIGWHEGRWCRYNFTHWVTFDVDSPLFVGPFTEMGSIDTPIAPPSFGFAA
jgi:hypothetical protein